MANFRFKNEIRVALNPDYPMRDRRWAIWRCCCVVSNVCELSVFELYETLADKVGFSTKRQPTSKEMPSNEQVLIAAGILVQLRLYQLDHLRRYEWQRMKKKRNGNRFPVTKFEQKEYLLELLDRVRNA